MANTDAIASQPPAPLEYAGSAERPVGSRWLLIAGAVLILGAAAASTIMAMGHLGAITVPGCGAGSACETAANSWFGKVPGTEWPISFVGTAYFPALLAGWLVARGRPTPALLLLLRSGAAMSVLYVGVMISGGYLCKWCLTVHSCNLLLWVLVELRGGVRRGAGHGSGAMPTIVATFAVVSICMAITQQLALQKFRNQQQQNYDESMEALKRKIEEDRLRAAQGGNGKALRPLNDAPTKSDAPATAPVESEPPTFSIGAPPGE